MQGLHLSKSSVRGYRWGTHTGQCPWLPPQPTSLPSVWYSTFSSRQLHSLFLHLLFFFCYPQSLLPTVLPFLPWIKWWCSVVSSLSLLFTSGSVCSAGPLGQGLSYMEFLWCTLQGSQSNLDPFVLVIYRCMWTAVPFLPYGCNKVILAVADTVSEGPAEIRCHMWEMTGDEHLLHTLLCDSSPVPPPLSFTYCSAVLLHAMSPATCGAKLCLSPCPSEWESQAPSPQAPRAGESEVVESCTVSHHEQHCPRLVTSFCWGWGAAAPLPGVRKPPASFSSTGWPYLFEQCFWGTVYRVLGLGETCQACLGILVSDCAEAVWWLSQDKEGTEHHGKLKGGVFILAITALANVLGLGGVTGKTNAGHQGAGLHRLQGKIGVQKGRHCKPCFVC